MASGAQLVAGFLGAALFSLFGSVTVCIGGFFDDWNRIIGLYDQCCTLLWLWAVVGLQTLFRYRQELSGWQRRTVCLLSSTSLICW